MSLGMHEILPDGGLASFQNHVSRIADLGRYEDAYIVHAAEGETVVPMVVFDENPRLKAMLFAQMRGMGIDPERYIVGNELNSINPVTGQPEFFLKKIFKEAKKAIKKIAPYAGLIAGAMGAGPGWSALAGGLGSMYAGGEGLDDWQAGLMGALSGYGAGKAFGTRGGPREGIFGSGDYIFGSKEGALSQLQSNIGLGGSTTAGGDVSKVLTSNQASALGVPEGTTFGELYQIGMIDNPAASKMTNWEKAILFGGPALGIAGEYFSGDKDDSEVDWGSPYATWGGNFAAPGVSYSANGGIINAYAPGGEVGGYTAGRDMAILEKDWRVPEEREEMHHDFEMDERPLTMEELRTESKLAQRLQGKHLNEKKQEFIRWAKKQVKKLARTEAGSGIHGFSAQRALIDQLNEMYNEYFVSDRFGGNGPTESEFPPRPVPGIEQEWGGTMEAQHGGIIDLDREYTEDKYADGGIAHLAGGSFPRMSGAISGPGGPKDDMVPAMLSDGEFVMTADAVRNAGGGDRREGARRMYQLMNQLQGVA